MYVPEPNVLARQKMTSRQWYFMPRIGDSLHIYWEDEYLACLYRYKELHHVKRITQKMAFKKQDVQTFKKIMEAAKAGSPDAQEKVATMFLAGKGVSPDAVAAREWYERAAKQGEPGAYYGLALINLEGNGVRKDKIEAYAYLLAMKSVEGLLKKRWDLSIAKRMLEAVSSLESKLSVEEKDLGERRFKAILRR